MKTGRVIAGLRLANTGTGHAFPTYVTPRVEMEIFQVDAASKLLEGTRVVRALVRHVAPDLSREIADTRLPPDAVAMLNYQRAANPKAVYLVFRVRVEPDAFYAAFYRDMLKRGEPRAGRKLIEQALVVANASSYILMERREPLATKTRTAP